MKKIILSFGLALISLSTFAQNECKCFENTYKIVGDLTYEEGSNKYYAGIKDGIVVFTHIQYSGDEAAQVYFESIAIENVNIDLNNMFSSKSKTTDEDGYTMLTLGGALRDSRNLSKYQWDKCYLKSATMGYSEQGRTVANGRFKDKAKLVELTDQIKSLQGK